MDPLHVAHLMALGIWLGIVTTEALFEFSGSDPDSLRAAARFHYTVDLFGELPILAAVIVTGVMLTARIETMTVLLQVKIAAALVAIGSNLICAVWVVQRRRVTDPVVLIAFRRKIWMTAAVGVVFGTAALAIGLVHFRG
jgi:hypothetical protein